MKWRVWAGSTWKILVVLTATLALTGSACGGTGGTAAQAPQQPVPAAQPAPAAPAQEPQPVPVAPVRAAPVPNPVSTLPKPTAQEPKYGGILTLVGEDPPGAWDIMFTNVFYGLHHIGAGLWGSGNLVRPCADDSYKVCPGLAESWEVSKDFTQFTFKLRDTVFWHDGKPFTGEDVKFWLELATQGAKSGSKTRRPAWFKDDLDRLQNVELLEGNRVRLTLSSPVPAFLQLLNAPYHTFGHPKHLMKPRIDQGDVTVAPLEIGLVGTGPFKILKQEKGIRVQVRRFDRYWEKDPQGHQLPYLDGIDFAILTNPAAIDAAIRAGRLDGASALSGTTVTPERIAGYVRDLGDRVWFLKTPTNSQVTFFLSFNMLRPGPWQDVKVRRATALWIDKKAAVEAIHGGFGYIGTLLNPSNPYTSPDFTTWPGWNQATREQDRAEAKRLLAEAGHASGFKMSYNCLNSDTRLLSCIFLKDQLARLGIDLQLDLMDAAQHARARGSLDYDATQGGGATFIPLPEAMERTLTRYSINNFAQPKHEDPRIPELFARFPSLTGFDERAKLWRQIERYVLLDQVYMVPVTGGIPAIPYRSYVKGRLVPAEGVLNYVDFATVWLDK